MDEIDSGKRSTRFRKRIYPHIEAASDDHIQELSGPVNEQGSPPSIDIERTRTEEKQRSQKKKEREKILTESSPSVSVSPAPMTPGAVVIGLIRSNSTWSLFWHFVEGVPKKRALRVPASVG